MVAIIVCLKCIVLLMSLRLLLLAYRLHGQRLTERILVVLTNVRG